MKKYFYKALVFSVISSLFINISCENYLDINESPNNPQLSELKPDAVLSAAQTTTAGTFGLRMNQLGNIMTCGWSANASDFSSPFRSEFLYDMTSTFYSDIWDNLYVRTNNFTFIENYKGEGNWDYYKAIAKIEKAFYFQYLVDLYGDLPYSKIHQGTASLFPTYDNDQDVYRELVVLTEEAVDLINTTDLSTVKNVSSEDVIFNGDMDKWVQFANTIKLRLLLRQSGMTDGATQTYLTNEFAELSGAQFISEDVTVNPGYLNADGLQNPFYAAYGKDAAGNTTSTNNLVGPSDYYANLLKGQIAGTTVSDNRLSRQFASRNSSPVVGVAQGASTGRPSKLGVGILKGSTQDLIIMLASESYFLQAEAVLKGYLSGSAQNLFNNGILSSFIQLGLTTTDANNYIANSTGQQRIGWGAGNDLEAIITQKWIANNSINGIESWIEYTRTGYPSNIPLPLTTTQTQRPNRLLYPNSEITGNSNNVPTQTSNSAFTTNVFWD